MLEHLFILKRFPTPNPNLKNGHPVTLHPNLECSGERVRVECSVQSSGVEVFASWNLWAREVWHQKLSQWPSRGGVPCRGERWVVWFGCGAGHFFRHIFHAGKIHRRFFGVHFCHVWHPKIQLTRVHLKSTKKLKGKLIWTKTPWLLIQNANVPGCIHLPSFE